MLDLVVWSFLDKYPSTLVVDRKPVDMDMDMCMEYIHDQHRTSFASCLTSRIFPVRVER